MMHLFHNASHKCSKATAETYSTSFAAAIRLLHKDIRQPVYSIYGFVRLADEIVDSFHAYDRKTLLDDLKAETWKSIREKISLNPLLHSFQTTVNQYAIDSSLIESFFHSMEMDLERNNHIQSSYEEYIYGSAEVVGLMCLKVFCEGNEGLYKQLTPFARSLGAAFQKINFLRDLKADYEQLNRKYFPGLDLADWTETCKQKIEQDIEQDMAFAAAGISQLPIKARFGVYVAYRYYGSLFTKIRRSSAIAILQKRIRVPDYHKFMILVQARFSMVLQ